MEKEILKWCLVIARRKGHVGFRNRVDSVGFFLGGSIPIVRLFRFMVYGFEGKARMVRREVWEEGRSRCVIVGGGKGKDIKSTREVIRKRKKRM